MTAEEIRLKGVAQIIAGQSPASEDVSDLVDGLPFIQGNAEFGSETPTPRLQCDVAPKKAQPGDLLLSVRAPVGAINIATEPLGIGRGVCAVRPRDVHGRFLWWWLHDQVSLLDAVSTGSTFRAVNAGQIGNLRLAIVDADWQRAIADFLDRETAQIDAMVDAQERLVALLEERRGALLTHVLFPGLRSLDALDEDAAPMRYLVESIGQGWSPECESYPGDEDEWSVLKLGSVNHGVFVPTENKRLPSDLEPRPEITLRQGDVVMSRANTRQLVGSAAVVPRDFPRLMLSDLLYRLRVKRSRVLPEYVASVLGSGPLRAEIELRAKGTSHSMQKISRSDILELRIPTPPLEEQVRRQSLVQEGTARIDAMIGKARESIALMKERRAALISSAVTGRINVRTGSEQAERELEEARA